MVRSFCDICEHEFKDEEAYITLDLRKGRETHYMRICDTCYKRMVYIVRNDISQENVKNMSFMNRLRMVFMRNVSDAK